MECQEGVTSDSRLKFEEYCNYVIDLKEQRGAKHNTIVSYRDLTSRIYPAIGHIKLKDIRADHLNSLYTDLAKPGARKGRPCAVSKIDFPAELKKRGMTRAKLAGCSNVARDAVNGKPVSKESADKIALAMGLKFSGKPCPYLQQRFVCVRYRRLRIHSQNRHFRPMDLTSR